MLRWLTVAMAFCLLSIPSLAHACKCGGSSGPVDEMKEATAVFTGKVTERTLVKGKYRITLEVSKSWKGSPGKEVVITTNPYDTSCGYPFEKGNEYLVFAYQKPTKDEPNPGLITDICTGTQILAKAADDIKALDKAKGPEVK